MTVALYAGSFDPFTNGHAGVLRAGLQAFERVVVAIGRHPTKPGFLPHDARAEVVRAVAAEWGAGARVGVVAFDGLVVNAARENGAGVLLRGLRDGTDLDYELQMAGMNGAMAPDVQTVFVPAEPTTRHITATLVRQIASMGGDVAPFVPPATLAALAARAK